MAEGTEYTVRQGRKEDMEGLLTLVQYEGWNTVIEHLNVQYDLHPAGVYVAESSEGEIIAHCASLPLDDSTGIIAYYVTKHSWRGRGVGRKVFALSCKALGKRQLVLNGALHLQGMYASGGFKVATFTLFGYESRIKDLNIEKEVLTNDQIKVTPLKEVGFQKILEYDQKIHPMDRMKILKWFVDFSHVALVIMKGDVVKGWGSLYKACRGFRLMPLYADSPEFARILLNQLLKSVEGNTEAGIEVAFPDDNEEAKTMFEEFGLTKKQDIKRMFTEFDVPIPNQLVYSILSYHTVLS